MIRCEARLLGFLSQFFLFPDVAREGHFFLSFPSRIMGQISKISITFISALEIRPLDLPVGRAGNLEESVIIHGQGEFKYF